MLCPLSRLDPLRLTLYVGTDKSGVSHHIRNIYNSGELSKKGTVAKFATVQNEGRHYNPLFHINTDFNCC